MQQSNSTEQTGQAPADSNAAKDSRSLGRVVLLGLFFAVHLSFYVSALGTNSYKHVYPQGEIQDVKTLDYSQVPNGAKTFFEGGETFIPGAWTAGGPRPYPVLRNVYHPLFTLVVGGVLQVFRLEAGFAVFALLKLGVTVYFFRVLYEKYRASDQFLFAAFVMLCHFSQSIEIGSGQYHFLLNSCIFMLLLDSVEGRSQIRLSLWYSLSLFVKPLTLLWIPLLLMRRTFWLAVVPAGSFFAATIIYYVWTGETTFYVDNLIRMSAGTLGNDALPRYSVTGILTFLSGPEFAFVTKHLLVLALLAVTYRMRNSLVIGVFVWVCYFLLFYSLVYDYHYTTLIPVLVLGILTRREFQDWFAKLLMVLICLPSPLLLFKAAGVFPYVEGQWRREIGANPVDLARNLSDDGMCVLMCLKVLPLLVLMIYVWYRHEPSDMSDGPGGTSPVAEPS